MMRGLVPEGCVDAPNWRRPRWLALERAHHHDSKGAVVKFEIPFEWGIDATVNFPEPPPRRVPPCLVPLDTTLLGEPTLSDP
jgi:hypothetical protein